MTILIQWILYGLVIFAMANLLPGIQVSGFGMALVVALVLGILNALLKPILLLLTLPINILTLGLFTFVINAALILLAANLIDGFEVDGFWWALIFSIVLAIISSALGGFTKGPQSSSS